MADGCSMGHARGVGGGPSRKFGPTGRRGALRAQGYQKGAERERERERERQREGERERERERERKLYMDVPSCSGEVREDYRELRAGSKVFDLAGGADGEGGNCPANCTRGASVAMGPKPLPLISISSDDFSATHT